MKNIIFVFLCLFFVIQSKGADAMLSDTSKSYSIKLAHTDISKGKIKLLIMGGFAPKHYEGEAVFEKKYKIKYYQFGCVLPESISIADYNKVVANYLDGKYGKGWRKEVRKDVVLEDVRWSRVVGN